MNRVIQTSHAGISSSSIDLYLSNSNKNEFTSTNCVRKTIRNLNSASNSNNTGEEMTNLPDDLMRSSVLANNVDLSNSLLASLASSSSANNLLSLASNNNNNNDNNNINNSTSILINNLNNQISSSASSSSSSSSTNAPSSNCLDKKKQHKCPFCERSFTRPYRLNDHISFSHTDERKYMCSICSKNFSCKDKLKHHIDIKHDNKKTAVKIKTKSKNTEDLKCSFPGCTKAFANKYNVKRHVENVHLKVKRKHNKSDTSNNNSSSNNNTNNSSSLSLNNSSNNHNNQSKLNNSIVNINNNKSTSNAANSTSIASLANMIESSSSSTKLEPTSTSTPIISSSKNISKLSKSTLNSNQLLAVNQPPLTLVNVSSIGGITLTALGSIHQQHQQQIQQQHQTFMQINTNPTGPVALNLASLSANSVSNNSTILISNQSQNNNAQANQIIFQQQPVLQQVLNINSCTKSNSNTNTNNQSINNTNLVLNNQTNLNTNSVFLKNANQFDNLNSNNTNNNNNNNNSNNINKMTKSTSNKNISNKNIDSFNAVTVAAAAELVNSLLVKSETPSHHLQQQFDNLNDLNFNNKNPSQTTSTCKSNQKQSADKKNSSDFSQHEQLNHQIEDEKDAKIYTCARCPEIFSSSNLLRKHVSESHEKEYECCICSMHFNNRFAFLKHKYFHMKIADKAHFNNLLIFKKVEENDEKNYKNGLNTIENGKLGNDIKNKMDHTNFDMNNNDINNIDLYDLNTLYKRCLMNRNTIVDVNMTFSASSQMATNTAKAKKLTNGNVNCKQDESNTLIKLIRQNSCCSICRKCISEKKKLIAHKKICMIKYNQKLNKESKSQENLSEDDGGYEMDEEEDESGERELTENSYKKQKNVDNKQKRTEKKFESNQTNDILNAKNQDSMNNIFLFE